MKRKALEQAAEELNFFLRLNPAINVRMPAAELEAKIIEAAALLESGEEELSLSLGADLEPEALEARKEKVTAIQNTLKELGVPLFVGAETETELNEKEETKVTETQIEVQGNAALLEMVQETKKLVDLKVIVNEEDEFTPLRESLGNYTGLVGPKLLKAEMLKMLGTEVLAPKKKEKKSAVILEKDKKKDLVQLFIDAIKEKTMTMSEIRKENWNSSGATFNSPLKKLLEKGLIIKEGVKMIWKGPSDYVIQRSGRKIIY